jgi:integration host factor subunit beta
MLKRDLIGRVATRRSMAHRQVEAIVDHLFDCMRRALARGEAIELRGLGRFQVRQYKGYTGRNPKTSAVIEIKPSRGVLFRTGKELKERLNAPRAQKRSTAAKNAPRNDDAQDPAENAA